MKLSTTSYLKPVPIEIRKDKKHFIVEDQASADFYEMTDVCIDAIKMMQNGIILGEIEVKLKKQYPQEDIDLIDFAGQLLELGLIEEIDGNKVDNKQKSKQSLGFQWVSPMVGKLFFNKLSMSIYTIFLIGNIIFFITKPNLFPRYKDMFIFHLMALNIPVWMILTFVLLLVHEFGHVLAIRAYHLPTKLEAGHRLFLVVLETDMSSVWKLPSKDRNRLYLAGLCFDNTILFFTLTAQLIFPSELDIFHAVLRAIVLDTFIRVLYQLCIYMKTDLYYVFENSTGCYNLMENAQQLLRKRFKLKNTKFAAAEVVFEGERGTVFWYSIFYLAGVVLTVSLYIFYYIPQMIYAIKHVLPGFEKPVVSLAFWNSAVFMLQILITFLLLGYSWIKKYRKTAQD